MMRGSNCLCRSGLVSRKGRSAAPGFQRESGDRRGCFAALSRHKAAPTTDVQARSQASPTKKALSAMDQGFVIKASDHRNSGKFHT
ncbi:hypothetical protein EI693_01340 [Pseudomonas oryziphila]|uniref:Uncharacterized protein n=1 Tax=Pseudomonas oryziphila TaxID=2894079 RepID=A0ABM7CKC2_9PSED|nr:hypothetical protein EI693_01340 [Pseudomonas oryziphila]